jgi:hypothetical protein
MKVTLQKVAMAYVAIKNVEKEKASNKWAYGIAKNKAKMQPDIDGISAGEKEMLALEEQRVAYCQEHCIKDKDGKPLIENSQYVGIDQQAPEMITFVESQKKLSADHEVLLKNEVEIDFHIIDFKDVPEQISPINFENLSIFIKEPESDKIK